MVIGKRSCCVLMLSLSNFYFLVFYAAIMLKEQFCVELSLESLGMKKLLEFLVSIGKMSLLFVRDVGFLCHFIKEMILSFYGLRL